MRQTLHSLILAWASLWVSPVCGANTGLETIRLEEFLERAKKNDARIEEILQDRVRADYLTDLSLPTSQILLEVRDEYGVALTAPGDTNILGASLSKEIVATGTSLSVDYSNIKRPDQTVNSTQVRVEQSLFRNFLGSATRLLDDTLKLESRVIRLEVAEALEDYMAEIIGFYLDWKLAHSNLVASRQLYEEAQKMQSNIKQRLRKSVASSLDLNRARVQTLNRKGELLKRRGELNAQSERVARITGMDANRILPPEKVEVFGKRKLNFAEESKRLFEEGRSMELVRVDQKAAEQRVDLSDGDLLPSLKMIAGYNVDNSTRFSTPVSRSDFVLGVNFSLPLGDSAGKARLRESADNLRKASLKRSRVEQQVRIAIAGVREQIQQQRSVVETVEQRLALARQIADTELKRYGQGRVDLETMINAQNAFSEAQFAFFSERVQLDKLVVEWLRVTDQLLSRVDGA